jgi:predicted aldo/keto reductase-like oxidoreductase
MQYRKFGKAKVEISVIGMGGHEYLPDGRSRGFNENFELNRIQYFQFKKGGAHSICPCGYLFR